MGTIIVVIVLILSALAGGIYYYQSMDKPIHQITQSQSVEYPKYLSNMLISSDTIYKIFSKYLKGVRAEEKLREVDENNITSIINVKFSADGSDHTVMFKNSVSIFTNNLSPSVDMSKVEEHINSRGIRLYVSKRANKGNLVFPNLLSFGEEPRPARFKGKGGQKKEGINASPYDPIDIYAYINNGKILIHSTSLLSFLNGGYSGRKKKEFLSIFLPILQKIRNQIQKEQSERIGNISS